MSSALQVMNMDQTAAEWAARIRSCRSSGLSVRQWCSDHNISPQTYYRWQRRLFDIGRRSISAEYDPTGAYDFPTWQNHFDADIRSAYESLHQTLLYTDEKQSFDDAMVTFHRINAILDEIDE